MRVSRANRQSFSVSRSSRPRTPFALTRSIEAALGKTSEKSLPAGMEAPQVTFRQASFIGHPIGTLQGKLIGASVFVAAILFFFLGTLRPTVIALTAIWCRSSRRLVFRYFCRSTR